jgi:hypothetical protein
MNSDEVVKKLNSGVLPEELNFSLEPQEIDWSKVLYNSYYKSYEFHSNKFPNGMQNLPAFNSIVDHMIENAKTPLEEITKRQENNVE